MLESFIVALVMTVVVLFTSPLYIPSGAIDYLHQILTASGPTTAAFLWAFLIALLIACLTFLTNMLRLMWQYYGLTQNLRAHWNRWLIGVGILQLVVLVPYMSVAVQVSRSLTPSERYLLTGSLLLFVLSFVIGRLIDPWLHRHRDKPNCSHG